MKICIKCNVEKEGSLFTLRTETSNKRRNICTECQRLYAKLHYKTNKSTYVKRAITFNKHQKETNRKLMLEFLQDKQCRDCKIKDYRVFEFDHKEGTQKKDNIANLMYRHNWQTVLEEIQKCDIRCANCHRIKTGIQFNWFKS